jgi:phage shock protein PspC (stress-responsive transcriptional regulator)
MNPNTSIDTSAMHRGHPRRVISGVCAMLAQLLGVDQLWVRVVALILLPVTGSIVLWLYLALWIVTPPSATGRSPLARAIDWVYGLIGSPSRSS